MKNKTSLNARPKSNGSVHKTEENDSQEYADLERAPQKYQES